MNENKHLSAPPRVRLTKPDSLFIVICLTLNGGGRSQFVEGASGFRRTSAVCNWRICPRETHCNRANAFDLRQVTTDDVSIADVCASVSRHDRLRQLMDVEHLHALMT